MENRIARCVHAGLGALASLLASSIVALPSASAVVIPMHAARAGHSATLLDDGRVIVVGGLRESTHSAELYDPGTARWQRLPGMPDARSDHTATRLPDGRMLVAGGFGAATAPASSDLYDPRTQRFTAGPPLRTPRGHHTATALANGDVLLVGGLSGFSPLAAVEQYDAAAGHFLARAPLAVPRDDHTSVRLRDGTVLVVGGSAQGGGAGPALASAELYDPARDTWAAAGTLAVPRARHTATLLADGRVLVVGGTSSSTTTATAEIFDPVARTWSPAGSLVHARALHTATLLPDGRVLVAGGYGTQQSWTSIEIYDPASGRWSSAATLGEGRAAHTATLLPDRRMLFVGTEGLNAQSASEVTDALPMLWSATTLAGPSISDHAITPLPDGRVLVTGGRDGSGNALAQARVFDPRSDTFAEVAPMPRSRAGHQALLMPDGRVLVVGGNYVTECYFYDPLADTWAFAGSLTWPRNGQVAVLLGNGKVMVSGGAYAARTEQYEPAANQWYALGYGASHDGGATATLLPDGRVLVAGGRFGTTPSGSTLFYHPLTYSWTAGPSMTWHRYGHRATLLADGRVLVVGGYGAGGQALPVTEIFDPVTDTWTRVGDTGRPPYDHALVPLPDGDVLAVGGNGVDRFDAVVGGWWNVGQLVNTRPRAEAALLPDGSVLVVGGYVTAAKPVERLARSWSATLPRPVLHSAPATLEGGQALVLTGEGFRGLGDAGGGTTRGASSSGPRVTLQRMDNGARIAVQPSAAPASDDTFTSVPFASLLRGWYRVTVAVDGVESAPRYVAVVADPPPASQVEFAATTYDLSEATGQANILVQRSGDCSLAAGVNLMGWNTSVSPPALWYTAPIDWAAGDCFPKRVAIGVPDDSIVNGDRIIELSFVNPANVTIGFRGIATLRVHDDEVQSPSMPASATIKANPYGPLKVTGATLSGNTLTQLQRKVTIELGPAPGTGNDALEIEFGNLRIGRGSMLTFLPGAAGQQVALFNAGGSATSIDGLVAAWDSAAFKAPQLSVHDPKGVGVMSTGRIFASSAVLIDALGARPDAGQLVRNEGTIDGGRELVVMGGGIHGGGFLQGDSIVLSTFGNANHPVNGNRYLANGLNLATSTYGGWVTLRLNHYGSKPQTFNVLVHGDATLMIPPNWPAAYAALPRNNTTTRLDGRVDAPYGGGQLIAQASGTLRLDGEQDWLAFPGGLVFRAGRFLDLYGMAIDNGWTGTGRTFQGMFFEAPRIGDTWPWQPPTISRSGLQTNNLNWVNFSTLPRPSISVWQVLGPGTTDSASATAVHLNPYASMIDTAASGGCWICDVDTAPLRLD